MKRFFRFSIGSIFWHIVCLFFIGMYLYYAIVFTINIINEWPQGYCDINMIFLTIIFYLGSIACAYYELTFLIGNIRLTDDKICVSSDLKNGREKIQYAASIKYIDIDSIDIVALRKDSKGNYIFLTRPIPFLILTNKKGKKARFNLCFMSKKCVKHLLQELLKRCKEVDGIEFDVDILVKKFSEARFAV